MCAVRGSCASTPTALTLVAVRKVTPRTRRESAQVSSRLKKCRPLRSGSDTGIFRVPRMNRRTRGGGGGGGGAGRGGGILSIRRTCNLKLSSAFCQAFVFTLFF